MCAQNKYIPTSFKKHLLSDPRCHSSESSHPRLGSALTDSLGLHILKTKERGPWKLLQWWQGQSTRMGPGSDGVSVHLGQAHLGLSCAASLNLNVQRQGQMVNPLTFSELMERLSTSHRA